ncbi:PIG-L deacetylase family protein [Nakamurella leprariae]|uniref:PIG-L family deacetylase n=1 Tax=Nakamurella leprariae TaxID=2803911 RepID=A0A939BZE5_9ACTN|nr:PIG-L deacetylase family protein [Nakamurella leprariae]MBM9467621.1 PIG-L family deacetylase [Nakamurella leprariae]
MPRPLAVSVGLSAPRAAVAALTGAGLELVRVPEAELTRFLDGNRRVVVALVYSGHPELTASIRRIRRSSPRGRIILLADAMVGAAELLDAMRAGVNDVLDPNDSFLLQRRLAEHVHQVLARRDRVLVVGAHPDDVEIGAAGTLLEHARRGDQLTVLTFSRGAVGGNSTDRVGESVASAGLLGARLLMGDFPDTRIDNGATSIRFVEAAVTEVDPTVVYVHTAHDGHQDHRAVHIATVSATRRVPRLYCYHSPSTNNDFRPTKFVAIDDTLSEKLKVLEQFASQAERTYLEPELVVAQSRFWARTLAPRAKYAEPFEVMRELSDPFPATRVQEPDTPPAGVSVLRIPT